MTTAIRAADDPRVSASDVSNDNPAAPDGGAVIRVGKPDPCGRRVVRVYRRTDAYVIYRWSQATSWLSRKETGVGAWWKGARPEPGFVQIGEELARVEGLRHGPLSGGGRIDGEIAGAIALAFEGDAAGASKALERVRKRLTLNAVMAGRFLYLAGGLLSVLTSVGVLLVRTYNNPAGQVLLDKEFVLLKIVACGALGAFLTICLRHNRRCFAAETPAAVHVLAGMTRVTIGVIAALIVYLILRSGLVLTGVLGDTVDLAFTTKQVALMLLLATVAGFSERFVPALLVRVEDVNGVRGASRQAGGGAAPAPPPRA